MYEITKKVKQKQKLQQKRKAANNQVRPDSRLPLSRDGGQGPYLRSQEHLGRSSEAKDRKNIIVAKALHGQRYPMPLCWCMWGGCEERGSGPGGADDL